VAEAAALLDASLETLLDASVEAALLEARASIKCLRNESCCCAVDFFEAALFLEASSFSLFVLVVPLGRPRGFVMVKGALLLLACRRVERMQSRT
jgi:hypothetical protein